MARFTFGQSKLSADTKQYAISIPSLYGGLCVSEMPYKLQKNQSPDCLNVWFSGGVLGKRDGLLNVADLGDEPIVSALGKKYHGYCIFQSGENIYAWRESLNSPTSVLVLTAAWDDTTLPSRTYTLEELPDDMYTTCAFDSSDGTYDLTTETTTSPAYVADGTHGALCLTFTAVTGGYSVTEVPHRAVVSKMRFLQYGDAVYGLNGKQYIRLSEANGQFSAGNVTPYVPTVIVNAAPANGGGTLLENFNRIGAGFTVKYSGTASTTLFTLPETDLDDTAPTVIVNGTTLTAEEYTFDKTAGTVTLDTAVTPGTNGVSITAYKTHSADVASITGCRYIAAFGGANEVKVVVGGNTAHPATFFASGTADPSYFPYNLYNLVGNPDDMITGFGGQYDTLIILKQRSVYAASYSLSDDGTVRIPASPVNTVIGCDCPDTIQVCANTLVWCNTTGGVYGLFSTDIANERNVLQLSGNVNGSAYEYGLLHEPDLKNAVSADIDGRYWLCVNNKVWLWDYSVVGWNGYQSRLSWWLFDNIHASAFILDGRTALFTRNDRCDIDGFQRKYYDYGQAIKAHWLSVPFEGSTTSEEKVFTDLFIECRGQTNTTAKLKYITDYVTRWDETDLKTRNFTLLPFSLATFSLSVTKYSKVHHRKPNARWTKHLQVGLYNEKPNEDLSVTGLTLEYRRQRSVR